MSRTILLIWMQQAGRRRHTGINPDLFLVNKTDQTTYGAPSGPLIEYPTQITAQTKREQVLLRKLKYPYKFT